MTGLEGAAPEEREQPEGRRDSQGFRARQKKPETEKTRAVLSATVKHQPGVLSEVSALFSRRRFNIESLTVGAMENPDKARITLVIKEPRPGIKQAKKQLEKLIPVHSVKELDQNAVKREIALLKLQNNDLAEVKAFADIYDAKIVDSSGKTATIELTGSQQKVEAAIEKSRHIGLEEVDRAGTVALQRGQNFLNREDDSE